MQPILTESTGTASSVTGRLRIAFVVHDYNRTGGHSRYVAELATRFSRDHDVHVFANRVQSEEAGRIRFHYVPAIRLTALTTVLTFAVPALLQVRNNFDIVHIQGFCGPQGNVVTIHQCNEAWYQALLRTDGRVSLKDKIFRLFTSALERDLYRGVKNHRIIAISRRVARDIAELYGCDTPADVIHHGVDLDAFSPETRARHRDEMRTMLGIPDEQMVFLFVGNMRKGAQQLIRALASLDSGIAVFTSASDPAPYRLLAEQLGCADRVRFPGPTNQVERVLAAADAFVLPTPYDPFALVCTEAMASGLPVIISREAGAAELVRHGHNGLILEDPGDSRDLSSKMDYLRRDRPRAAEMGRAARLSMETFSWDAVADLTMQLYRETVGARQ
jgi:UDP-glucose:(heptosyl)LPS alpha-1,3-glucosyltransferase